VQLDYYVQLTSTFGHIHKEDNCEQEEVEEEAAFHMKE
jgi:hypothetical protein